MKRIVSFLMILLLISSKTNAEQLSIDDCSFEVKFLLSPEKVLAGESMLSEAIAEKFGLAGDYTVIDVVYLETADRSFINDGWVNRIRWKRGKKKPERTYKKRYNVAGDDQASILSCLEKVASDGIDVRSEACSLEVDWGYSKMTLSATWETSGKYKDYQSLQQFTTEDLISYFAETMPSEECDWKYPGWAAGAFTHAQKAGIISLNRIKGVWEDTESAIYKAAGRGNRDCRRRFSRRQKDLYYRRVRRLRGCLCQRTQLRVYSGGMKGFPIHSLFQIEET